MKGLTWVEEKRRPGHGAFVGWLARTQWKGKVRRRRFSGAGGVTAAVQAMTEALHWLSEANKELRKPASEKWIRSGGRWGRGRKTGPWRRRE